MTNDTHTTGHDENGNLEHTFDEEDEYGLDEQAEFEATVDIDAFWNKVDAGKVKLSGGNTERARRDR